MAKLTREQAEQLSGTTLQSFNPYVIPMQADVINLLRSKWDYEKGTPEVLLSGSYGSSKSILLAHIAITHCLINRKAEVFIGRRSLPDLKKTIWQEILDHLLDLKESVDYIINKSEHSILFVATNSKIITGSWADKKYKKFRSLRLSMCIIEELTENDEQDFEAFKALKGRLRRRPWIKENVLICATNPDDPNTWQYRYFIESQPHETRFVFYSNTEDNPFLDPVYINQLKKDLDPISIRRYLNGEWVSIQGAGIYHCYDNKIHYKKDEEYIINDNFSVDISWDFNIGLGKPLSVTIGQYISGVFHVERSICIESISTSNMMDEIQSLGYFDRGNRIKIYGDATGQARSTMSLHSNYEIIKNYLANYVDVRGNKTNFDMSVPRSNPPIMTRHNKVNAHLKNGKNETRLFLYKNAKKLDEGLRLTKLKKGADYQEDDANDYQHVTTALGYWINSASLNINMAALKNSKRF